MKEVTYIVTTLLNPFDVDVIAFQDNLTLEAFQEFATKTGLKFQYVTPERAAQLLRDQNGIGLGCFVQFNQDSAMTTAILATLSKRAMAYLSEYIGLVVLHDSIDLSTVKAKESELAA